MKQRVTCRYAKTMEHVELVSILIFVTVKEVTQVRTVLNN